jgi:hypothetical protein
MRASEIRSDAVTMRFRKSRALAFVLFLAAGPVHAQDTTTTPAPASTCVDVRIGNDRSVYLDCLNQQLKDSVEQQRTTAPLAAPIGAQSQSNQVGTFNENAAREKMGDSFGKSAVAQRPQQNYVNPLVGSSR